MDKEDLVLKNLQKPNQRNSYIFNIYVKEDLALNNLHWLIYLKIQTNQIELLHTIYIT